MSASPVGEPVNESPAPGEKPPWAEYFIGIAQAASARSGCVRSKVGAAVVKDNRVRSLGYNDAPAGLPGCEACPRRQSFVEPGSDYDYGPGQCHAIHAEANALLHCNREDLIDATLYITREPCVSCMKLIMGSGVAEVVWPQGGGVL